MANKGYAFHLETDLQREQMLSYIRETALRYRGLSLTAKDKLLYSLPAPTISTKPAVRQRWSTPENSLTRGTKLECNRLIILINLTGQAQFPAFQHRAAIDRAQHRPHHFRVPVETDRSERLFALLLFVFRG